MPSGSAAVTPQEQVSLVPFSTLGIGGPARYYLRAGTLDAVANVQVEPGGEVFAGRVHVDQLGREIGVRRRGGREESHQDRSDDLDVGRKRFGLKHEDVRARLQRKVRRLRPEDAGRRVRRERPLAGPIFGIVARQGVVDLVAEHLDPAAEPDQVLVGIETERGPWVQALLAAGYVVFAINPMQVARYRERHSTSGAKSDPADAHLLAEIVRLDRAHHRGTSAQ